MPMSFVNLKNITFVGKSGYIMPRFLFLLLISIHINVQSQEYAAILEFYSDYDVKFYKLDIEVDNLNSDVKGRVDITAELSIAGLKHFTLDLASNVLVESVLVNGKSSSFTHEKDLLHVLLTSSLPKGMLCVVSVFYTASDNTKDGDFFTAVRNKKDNTWDIPITWILSEPYNAKKWFPCKQYLPDKADSAYIFITVPEHLKAGAPGLLSAVTPVAGNKLRYEWKTRYPVAYYLLSFAVSDYIDYSIYAHPKELRDSLLIQNFVYNRPGYLQENQSLIDTTCALVELFSELFLPYPFGKEKYGHCVAPMNGGMEHQTMTTLSHFDFLLVAHELAHQWFGNLVTCASFQDVWVNEGFASYSEYLALERLGTLEVATEWMKATHITASRSNTGSVFIPKETSDDTWRIFNTSLSYKKGAALVHNIRRIVNNDELFFDVLRSFLQKYEFSTATAMDFKNLLETRTGMDFGRFFQQWYFGEGYPVFDVSWTNDKNRFDILMEHIGSSSDNPQFRIDIDVSLRLADGTDTIIILPIRVNRDMFSFTFPETVVEITIDPKYYVLKRIQDISLVKDLPTDDNFVQCDGRVRRNENLTVNFARPTRRNSRIRLTEVSSNTILYEATLKNKTTDVVPLGEMSAGTYLLYVEDGQEQYIRKIVKTRF